MSANDNESSTHHDEHVDLNQNVAAKIRNPLAGIPRDQLLRNVEAFAKEKDLVDIIPTLNKGAIRKFSFVWVNEW